MSQLNQPDAEYTIISPLRRNARFSRFRVSGIVANTDSAAFRDRSVRVATDVENTRAIDTKIEERIANKRRRVFKPMRVSLSSDSRSSCPRRFIRHAYSNCNDDW